MPQIPPPVNPAEIAFNDIYKSYKASISKYHYIGGQSTKSYFFYLIQYYNKSKFLEFLINQGYLPTTPLVEIPATDEVVDIFEKLYPARIINLEDY